MAIFDNNPNLQTTIRGIEFFALPQTLLELYFPTITQYISWIYLYQDIYIYEKYHYTRSLPVVGALERITDAKYLNYISNEKSDSETVYFPIERYIYNKENETFTIIIINNKTKFLSLLGMNKVEDIYIKCPFLLSLLCDGVKHNSNINYGFISDFYVDYYDKHKKTIIESPSQIEKSHPELYKLLLESNVLDSDALQYNSYQYNVISSALKCLSLPNSNFFHLIANSHYEGSENKGYMTFCKKENNVSRKVSFEERKTLEDSDSKYLRKLLEMTSAKNKLLVEFESNIKLQYEPLSRWTILGIGNADADCVCTIHFLGSSKWEMSIGLETISYDGNKFNVRHLNAPADKTEIKKVRDFFKKINDGEKSYDKVSKVLKSLRKQKHGTMLVVSDCVEAEVQRLCRAKRGIQIQPVDLSTLDEETLLAFSSIDGAMLIRPNCYCYGLGIILDGYIDSDYIGDQGRGARYNSAKLYIHNIKSQLRDETETTIYTKHNEALAVVFSEDGYINVFSTI